MSIPVNIDGKEIDTNTYKSDWAMALMTKGVIANLTISRWRATTPLKAEELGLKFADPETCTFMKRYVRLGSEKLLPPEILNEFTIIESRARRNLDNHSFNTIWGRFIPYTAFNSWETENKQIEADFLEAAKCFGEKYPEIIGIVRTEYKKMAKDVWARINPDAGEAPQSYIDEFVSRVISRIPSRNDIVKTFKFRVTFFIIPMPSLIAEDLAKADKIERDNDLKNHELQLEKETKEKIAKDYLQRKSELVDSFLEATVSNMRSYVGDLCDNVLLSLTNGVSKDIKRSQIKKIKGMIDKVRILNFYDDKEIRIQLNELETEVDKFKGARDKGVIMQKLQDIVDIGTENYLPDEYNPAISSLEI